MDSITERVPGADGLSLQLRSWGPAPHPSRTLLLLHGFGHDAHVWDEIAPALAPGFRVLGLDARGHGGSDRDPEYRYSHAAVARDVSAVVEHLGAEPLAIVAHSMGGYAAMRFAARRPEAVSRLVLVDAGPELRGSLRSGGGHTSPREDPSYASPAEYEALLARGYPRARPETLARLARHWLSRREDGRYVPTLDPAFLRPRSASDAPERRSFDRAAWVREESKRLWNCLERIPCPTLVVRGAESPMLAAETVRRMVASTLANGCAVEIEGAGHAVMLDAPDALRSTLADFLL